MIENGTIVTIENGPGQVLGEFVGRTATVFRKVGPFYLLEVDGDVYGCLEMFVQPKVTAAALAARFETHDNQL
jgi:hypothetical protein